MTNQYIQIAAITSVILLMGQAWRYLHSGKVYIRETKIMRAAWCMATAWIIATAIW